MSGFPTNHSSLSLSLPETEADAKASILYQTRIFEMVGYSVSLASILASLCILSAFRFISDIGISINNMFMSVSQLQSQS